MVSLLTHSATRRVPHKSPTASFPPRPSSPISRRLLHHRRRHGARPRDDTMARLGHGGVAHPPGLPPAPQCRTPTPGSPSGGRPCSPTRISSTLARSPVLRPILGLFQLVSDKTVPVQVQSKLIRLVGCLVLLKKGGGKEETMKGEEK